MMNLKEVCLLVLTVLAMPTFQAAAQKAPEHHTESRDDNDLHHQHHEAENEHEEAEIVLSDAQQHMAGIRLDTLQRQPLNSNIYAPAEIKVNGYKSYVVSPRVDSVVTSRHVTLGENVTVGQPLITLFSDVMVDMQSELQQAWSDWQRVEKLGAKAVGEQRFVESRTRYMAAIRRLTALGIDGDSLPDIAGEPGYPLGEYTLSAQTSGVVVSDDFNQGQRIEAGQSLMLISDESSLWVEARFPAQNDIHLQKGTQATVLIDGMQAEAVVTQEAHTIDPHTRTRVVRMLLDNQSHQFHSGMFADVYFAQPSSQGVLAVQDSALMRNAQGQWQLFVVDEDDGFVARTVALGERFGDWQQISGVEEGTRYVSEGAFFVASELAKGGFDPHNH